jgi:hypothetical protein
MTQLTFHITTKLCNSTTKNKDLSNVNEAVTTHHGVICTHKPSVKKTHLQLQNAKITSNTRCRIWGSHSGGYEEFYLLGYNAV